jgi:hypothetical protein
MSFMEMTSKDLVRVIECAAKSGVTELKVGDIEIKFGPHLSNFGNQSYDYGSSLSDESTKTTDDKNPQTNDKAPQEYSMDELMYIDPTEWDRRAQESLNDE